MKLTPIISLDELHLAVEAHGCKSWVNNLSNVPHTLGILTANSTDCIMLLNCINGSQVNARIVLLVCSSAGLTSLINSPFHYGDSFANISMRIESATRLVW